MNEKSTTEQIEDENICDLCCLTTPDKYIECIEHQQRMTGKTLYKACEFTFIAPCGATVQVEIEANYTKPERGIPYCITNKYREDFKAAFRAKVEEFAKNRFKDKKYLQSLEDQKKKMKRYNITTEYNLQRKEQQNEETKDSRSHKRKR